MINISRVDHDVKRVTAVRKPNYIRLRTMYFEYFATFVTEDIAIGHAVDTFMDNLTEPLTRGPHFPNPSVRFGSPVEVLPNANRVSVSP